MVVVIAVEIIEMHGASRWFNASLLITSAISSSVPVPPGKAMNASPSSIILVFAIGHILGDDQLGQTVQLQLLAR